LNHGAVGYNRKVVNEETEIMPYLLDKGFTIVKGDEPLLTMINYFHSASEIVFPHGSLIHNAIFCSNRPKILEFMSEHRLRDHFYLLFNDLASNYDMIISKADSELTNNITIDINTLRSKL
jgi:capsular polysaccharide biosynthesis protein